MAEFQGFAVLVRGTEVQFRRHCILRPEFDGDASAESLILRLYPNPDSLWSRIEATMALDRTMSRALDGRRRKNTAMRSTLGILRGDDYGV